EAGDEHVVGIVALEVLGLLGPAERGEGPQRRAEPGVEHVLVLAQRLISCLFARFFLGFGDENMAVLGIPSRNPVAPPQLARDAPWLDVLEPVVPGLLP